VSREIKLDLSAETRKCLEVQLGDPAGKEVAELIRRMAHRISELERGKVNVTPIVPLGR
jgi:hypothetical protein